MNNSVLIQAGLVAILFLIIKFIEMRFITKSNIPPKQLIRDGVLVFVAFTATHYLLKQFGSEGKRSIDDIKTYHTLMHTLNSTMSRASDLTTVKVKDIDFTNGIMNYNDKNLML